MLDDLPGMQDCCFLYTCQLSNPSVDRRILAHALLVTGYLLVWTGRKFEDLGADHFDRLDRERLTKRLVKRLERLGHKVSLQPAA